MGFDSPPRHYLRPEVMRERKERVSMERMTKAAAAEAAKHYAAALERSGLISTEQAKQVCIAAPYGQVHYLVRYDKQVHAYYHDLPGFTGSGGSGSLSLRDLVERVRHSTGLIYVLKNTAAPWVAHLRQLRLQVACQLLCLLGSSICRLRSLLRHALGSTLRRSASFRSQHRPGVRVLH